MVNGFVREGVLHDERIARAIPEQLRLIEKFKRENQGIAFVKKHIILIVLNSGSFPATLSL